MNTLQSSSIFLLTRVSIDNAHVQKQRILQGTTNEMLKVRTQLITWGVATSTQVCTTIHKQKIEHKNNEMRNNEKEERKL